jgi:hypothetical protein
MVSRSAINYNNFTDTPAASSVDQGSSIKWIHVADASLRIEAIISGQAIAAGGGEPIIIPTTNIFQPTQTTMVQPPDAQNSRKGEKVAATEAFIIPVPHTVVVIRQERASSPFRPESNESSSGTRRIGRLSQQFFRRTRRSISLSPPRGQLERYHDCCPTLRVLTECCGLAPHPVGQPVMC